MSGAPLDPDRLKELVGELAPLPNDEVEVIHDLAASGHAQKSMAEITAAAVAAIEAGAGPRRKYSTDEPPPAVVIRRSRTSWFVLALVLAIALGVRSRAFRRSLPPLPGDPVTFVVLLSPAATATAALPPEWSTTRGTADSLTERARAVRVGSLLVEFERGSVRGDTTAQPFADAIAALLSGQPDGAEAAAVFAAGGDGARTPEARRALAPLVRAAPMALRGWIQAGRVAAAAHDGGFFAGQQSREAMAALLAMPGMTAEVEATRDRLDTLLHRRGRPDFAAVADALELIQREMAN